MWERGVSANSEDHREKAKLGLPQQPSDLLQYSCLANPMDKGAWQTTVHRVTEIQRQLKQLSKHAACVSV